MNSSTKIITDSLRLPRIDARKQITLEYIQNNFRTAFLFVSGSSSDAHISFDAFFTVLKDCKNMLNGNPEENKEEIEILSNFIDTYEEKIQGRSLTEQKQILQEMVREIKRHFDYTPKTYKLSTMIATTVENAFHSH